MQAGTTRKEQKEQTRRRLIDAAAALFAKEGIAATATADVAKALKVSHGTVFVHFERREDLLAAVMDSFGERLSEELQRAVASESSLERILKAHLNTLAEFEDFYFRVLTELQFLPRAVRSTVFMLNSAVSWKMFEAAAPLMNTGKLKKTDKALFFNTWMALVHYHIVNREQLSERTPILKEKGDVLARHFLALMKT